MKGDVRIFKIKDNSDITADKIRLEKKKLHDDINKGKKTPCSGCPYLTKDYWPELKELELNNLSIIHHFSIPDQLTLQLTMGKPSSPLVPSG